MLKFRECTLYTSFWSKLPRPYILQISHDNGKPTIYCKNASYVSPIRNGYFHCHCHVRFGGGVEKLRILVSWVMPQFLWEGFSTPCLEYAPFERSRWSSHFWVYWMSTRSTGFACLRSSAPPKNGYTIKTKVGVIEVGAMPWFSDFIGSLNAHKWTAFAAG